MTMTDAELAALEQALWELIADPCDECKHRDCVVSRGLRALLTAYRQQGEELRQVTEERDKYHRMYLTVDRFRSEDAATHLDDQAFQFRARQAAEAALKVQGEALTRLREALGEAACALTCPADEDYPQSHWCPQCDDAVDRNSITRNKIRALLETHQPREEPTP